MKTGKKQFIAGAMAGSLFFSLAFDLKRLDAIQGSEMWHRMAPELRLGYDLGFLSPEAFEPYNWTAPISRRDFEQALNKAIQLLGISGNFDIEVLAKANMINHGSFKRNIKRAEAFEKIFQTLILLETYGYVKMPESETNMVKFSDYRIPKEYAKAMTFLVNRGIIKGYSDGRLYARRNLTNRDCVYLISRLYELLAVEKQSKMPKRQLSYLDLPMDHWVFKQLEGLDSVGGLSLVRIGAKFDGDCRLSVGECAGMLAGILVHFNRADVLAELNAVCEKVGPSRTFDRKLLARLLAIMLRNLTHLYPSVDEQPQISYSDVEPGSELSHDLAAISYYGIQLGYVGGRFAGDEKITRFEAVGTLYAAVAPLIGSIPGQVTADSVAVSPEDNDQQKFLWGQTRVLDEKRAVDIDEFVARIKAKQKRIRDILDRNKNRPSG
ncbi:MAG: hypothetical protein A2W80_18260 [Candidatus Riflebacteria bacterium GWC2_50_8]|nr:MAG: hypothetical protein A2W80_18260 [Candidatus Riflebacteria bacterium GWC2_50_8]